MSFAWSVLAGLFASTAALVGSALLLALKDRARPAGAWLLSFAIGTLLGAATLGLLPEALEQASPHTVMPMLLVGMLGFIVFERVLRWRHPHQAHPGEREHHPGISSSTAAVLLWGDGLHNLLDGVVLGLTFSSDAAVGTATALAVFAHEVPQEIGDFAVLLQTGMPRRRALVLNYLSAAAVIPGAMLASLWASTFRTSLGWLLPIAAGGFIYIALADLVPALHHRRGGWAGLLQLLLMGAGVLLIWALSFLRHGAG